MIVIVFVAGCVNNSSPSSGNAQSPTISAGQTTDPTSQISDADTNVMQQADNNLISSQDVPAAG